MATSAGATPPPLSTATSSADSSLTSAIRLHPLIHPSSSSSSSSPPPARRLPADDDCCICFNGDSDDTDPILFCDGPGCTAVVHQSCYGVPFIPEGDWLCDSCHLKANPQLSPSPLLLSSFNRCLLCPSTEGAFKPTADNTAWVHASCAIWTPETGFADAEKVDKVIGIETIDRNRWRLVCDVCGIRQGTCVQCLGPQCRWSAHVTCGWKAGYRMEFQMIGHGEEMDIVKLVYCDRHRGERWEKGRRRRGGGVKLNDQSPPPQLIKEGGYRCVRCGSRSRLHECKRGEEEEREEDEEEEEDADLKYSLSSLSITEQEQIEQREREEGSLWDAIQAELDREKAAERERRQREAAAEEGTLYEELKRAHEAQEEAYMMGEDEGKEKKKRKKQPDDRWEGEEKGGEEPPKKRGRGTTGDGKRLRRCTKHKGGVKCARDCPDRPPPFTEEERKKREQERRARAKVERKRKREEERMSTTAPHQRKVIRQASLPPPSTLSSSSFSSSSPPLPPPSAPVSVPPPAVVHPIPAPPPVVLPPLSSSPTSIITRPSRPLTYSVKDAADISLRLSSLLSSSSPPEQSQLLKQLLIDSPAAYYREVERRLKDGGGVEIIVKWLKEARETQAWALVSLVMQALARMAEKPWASTSWWPVMIEEVGRNRGALSEGLRREADKLWKRLLDLGLVKDEVKVEGMAATIRNQIAGTVSIGGMKRRGEEGGEGGKGMVPSHPPPSAVKAAMERAKGREAGGQKRRPAVNAALQFRAQAAEEEKRRAIDRRMQREYEAGVGGPPLYPPYEGPPLYPPYDAYHYYAPPPPPPPLPQYSQSELSASLQAALEVATSLIGHVGQGKQQKAVVNRDMQALQELQKLQEMTKAASQGRVNGYQADGKADREEVKG